MASIICKLFRKRLDSHTHAKDHKLESSNGSLYVIANRIPYEVFLHGSAARHRPGQPPEFLATPVYDKLSNFGVSKDIQMPGLLRPLSRLGVLEIFPTGRRVSPLAALLGGRPLHVR